MGGRPPGPRGSGSGLGQGLDQRHVERGALAVDGLAVAVGISAWPRASGGAVREEPYCRLDADLPAPQLLSYPEPVFAVSGRHGGPRDATDLVVAAVRPQLV